MKKNRADKEDKAILTITNHIGLMSYMALYDVFGFKEKRIRRYYEEMITLKKNWRDDQVPTEGMLKYCEQKKIDIFGFTQRIPTSTKLKLCGKNCVPGVMNYIKKTIGQIIDEQPTAYDVDKVVKWLETKRDFYYHEMKKAETDTDYFSGYCFDESHNKAIMLNEAIEIVKRGGI
jgi:hypothetical protein